MYVRIAWGIVSCHCCEVFTAVTWASGGVSGVCFPRAVTVLGVAGRREPCEDDSDGGRLRHPGRCHGVGQKVGPGGAGSGR